MTAGSIVALVVAAIGGLVFLFIAWKRMKMTDAITAEMKRRINDLATDAEVNGQKIDALVFELDLRCPVKAPTLEADNAAPDKEVTAEETAPAKLHPPRYIPPARPQPQQRTSATRPSSVASHSPATTGSGNGGMMFVVLIAVLLAGIIGTYLVVDSRNDDKAETKKTKTSAALAEKDKAPAAPTAGFDCSLCEQLPLPAGTIAALENIHGVPTWNVQCGGTPGCENCMVDCKNDDATPPSGDCYCKQK